MATPTTLPSTFVAGNVLTAAEMNNLRGAFRVLQVVSTAKDDTFSTTSTSLTDVTGLSVSITPSATSSKVLVFTDVYWSCTGGVPNPKLFFTVTDGSDVNQIAASSPGNRIPSFLSAANLQSLDDMYQTAFSVLLSPNTTSATTYKVRARITTGTGYVNRSATDTDTNAFGRGVSTITAMEISA